MQRGGRGRRGGGGGGGGGAGGGEKSITTEVHKERTVWSFSPSLLDLFARSQLKDLINSEEGGREGGREDFYGVGALSFPT